MKATVIARPCVHEFDKDDNQRCSICYRLRCPDCYGYGLRVDSTGEPAGPKCAACRGEGVDPAEDDSITQGNLF